TDPNAGSLAAAFTSVIREHPWRTVRIGACSLGSGGGQLSAATTVVVTEAGNICYGEVVRIVASRVNPLRMASAGAVSHANAIGTGHPRHRPKRPRSVGPGW